MSTEMDYDEEIHSSFIKDHLCPICGGRILVCFTCHTYGEGDKWKACMPCDSAGYLYCESEDCYEIGYTWGLNPRNPRSKENEKYRPEWLVGDWPY